ncbi:hypothetical protein E3N88_10980 [Mikania micrantha]|uniref:Remorin C-terminal domain-containing protein n=1 Tax=Mikania micrantha TaxID=192012 RepID=A0A5N6PDB0_9ASTR|nr:hypothetical protein E3N88_10980 [Mikania micrantha]
MPNYDQRIQNLHGDEETRVLHALTPPFNPLSMASSDQDSHDGVSDMSVTNSMLVLAGTSITTSTIGNDGASNWGEDTSIFSDGGGTGGGDIEAEVSARSFRKEEVESKIRAWKNAKIAEINNKFKCEDAIINGWEAEEAERSALWMKKVEQKLEEKRVRAMEKMENEIAKTHRKAEERRASVKAKRGTKIARVVEVANLMKIMGRAPVKSSFF